MQCAKKKDELQDRCAVYQDDIRRMERRLEVMRLEYENLEEWVLRQVLTWMGTKLKTHSV